MAVIDSHTVPNRHKHVWGEIAALVKLAFASTRDHKPSMIADIGIGRDRTRTMDMGRDRTFGIGHTRDRHSRDVRRLLLWLTYG